jgi:hypothetical protein
MCLFVPEVKRLHGVVERVVGANETTSTPSKIISSSINNLAVRYDKRDPISEKLHLFGYPCLNRTTHIYYEYGKKIQSLRPYYFCRIAVPFEYGRDSSLSELNQYIMCRSIGSL